MKKTVILNVSEKKGFLSQAYRCEEHANMSLVTIKNSKRALRRLSGILKGENIVINHLQKDEYIFNNCIKPYADLSYKTVIPVMDKICRCVAEKYVLQLPFEEIYIVANPATAYEIILPLIGMGRMFTIVSEEGAGREADSLYFEHGCIIRHIKRTENRLNPDCIIIRAEERGSPHFGAAPVINLVNAPAYGEKVLSANNISVSDDNILQFSQYWGGSSGLSLYELTEEIPAANAEIDINKNADTIFLLDTNQI